MYSAQENISLAAKFIWKITKYLVINYVNNYSVIFKLNINTS